MTLNRIRPSQSYKRRFPLPSLEQQPPRKPLLDPAPVASIYDVGFFHIINHVDYQSRSFVFASHQSDQFRSDEITALIFANDPNVNQSGERSSWFTLESKLSFIKKAAIDDDWDTTTALRPSASTPLFVVHHELTVNITCSYTFPDTGEVSVEELVFTVMPSFGHTAPPPPLPILPSSTSSDGEARNNSVLLPAVEAYSPVLPIYSQLYDTDGNIKIDYSVPLPLYTPENSRQGDLTSDSQRWKDVPTHEILDGDSDSDEASPLLGTVVAEPASV